MQVPTVTIAGQPASGGSIARPLSIVHGRSGVDHQPDASSAEILWCESDSPWAVGDGVTIVTSVNYLPVTYDDDVVTYDDPRALYDGVTSKTAEHFTGTIAAIDAAELGGIVQEWRLDCIGPLAALGRIPVTITRPAESDVARVAGLASAAGFAVRILGTAGVTLAPATIDSDALTALHDVCETSGGLLWQSRQGTVTYESAHYRVSASKPLGVIGGHVIEDGVSWATSVDDIINHITVSWGPDSARLESTQQDAASVAAPWGMRHLDLDTQCNTQADADQLALLILARRAWPYWGGSNKVIDLGTDDINRLFSRLDVSSPVMVPVPVDPGPTPSPPAAMVLEGFIETWTEGLEHTAEAALSDQKRWATTTVKTYTEVQAVGTYNQILALGTYSDVLIKEG